MDNLPLNDVALPYSDPLHPIVVHFVIAMVLFAFLCDLVGHFSSNRDLSQDLFEVSFWNMVVASIAAFVAIIVGQFEASLAPTYPAVEGVLVKHQIIGWSLSALIAIATAWRFIIRTRSLFKVPPSYLGVATFLIALFSLQIYLGTQLVWTYGIHVKPVVQAIEQGKVSQGR